MLKTGAVRVGLMVLTGTLLWAPIAWAQQASGIAGIVKDTSGAVLPGVTVETASPALIEKVRTVVTDGEGRYNIVDLRPGSYVVTFTLAGFNTFKREGIVLTAGFTATVNADMTVGALEETITVSGAAPLVDAQNARQQAVLSNELLKALPSGSMGLMGVSRIVPGMSGGTDLGGANGIYAANNAIFSTVHGKGGTVNTYDGMQTNNLGGTGAMSYVQNTATVEETTVETGGGSAESSVSGVTMNMVPKEGGNVFSFGTSGTYSNRHLQSDNLSDSLRARGLTTVAGVLYVYDFNQTIGGPIRKDRMWFFTATRFSGTQNQVAGFYFNKTQGVVGPYTPDLTRQAFRQEWLKSQGGRITWQVSPKNKVNVFADLQDFQLRGQARNEAPEAQGSAWSFWPDGLLPQVTWNSPVTNKWLLEAGYSLARNAYPLTLQQATDVYGFVVKPTDISIMEASTGLRYNARSIYTPYHVMNRYAQRFSMSHVTGSHAFKTGFQLQEHVENAETDINGDVNYIFNRGAPTTITQFATPYVLRNRTKADLGLFVQDRWTVKRLTLNYGLRFDYFNGYVPAQHVDAGQFVGVRDFAAVHCVPCWTDLDPRVGASYDLFGNGRTALKAALGRFVGRMSTLLASANNPITTSVSNVNRSWNDANGNYVPDCDLHNFAANGECGAISNVNFGQNNPSATRYADDVIHGFGARDYLWDLSAEVQQQIGQVTSVSGGYYRNWTSRASGSNALNVGVTDNSAVTPADFSPYCITAPVDPRLPGGGGYPVCGLYDVAPAKFGQGSLLVTQASNYGKGQLRTSNFFSTSITTRFRRGVELGGSVDTGRTMNDNCYVVDSPQQLLNCHIATPFKGQTQVKVHGNYPLPRGFAVSAVLQNVSGSQYEANYAVPNAAIAPSLGRPLAACGTRAACTATATVPLIVPQTQFEPRRTGLDLRLSKIFSLGPRRILRANLDVYNVLNDSSVVGINNTYGATWRQPVGVGEATGGLIGGRLFQFGGQLNF